MTFELKKINVLSAIKVSFIIHVIIGLLIGLLVGSLMALVMSSIGQIMPYDQMGYGGMQPGAIGAFGGIFMVIIYAGFIAVFNGIIVTGIIALLYNLIAGWVGGIKVDLREVAPVEIKPSATLARPSETGGDPANA